MMAGGAILLAALAGCNFSPAPAVQEQDLSGEQKTPTPAASAAQETTPTATPTPIIIVVTNTPTATTAPPTSSDLGIRPTATATEVDLGFLPSRTPTATPSSTPVLLPASTLLPSATLPAPTALPYTATPRAQVCATCGGLRLRDRPGTAGTILTTLSAETPLNVVGRTADNTWLQVTTPDGRTGWVAASYVEVHVNLNLVGVSGVAANASPTPTTPPAQVAGGPGAAVSEIVTGITAHARQIFLAGQARGNLAHAFSRVGDSITAAGQFLNQIGTGPYSLGEYGYLADAISFFSGPNGRGGNPFSAPSVAAYPGWSTESLLDPSLADPNLCQPEENPLQCEYRLNRPAVALIMIGTNDAGGLPTETYAANLRRIVQISIDMGVIPVLSTLPPKQVDAWNNARVDEFNQVIVATARAFDIPLWNYWQALQGVPNRGLSADGVHPSAPPDNLNCHFDAEHLAYGYPVRNLTALQALDQLWRQVLYDADTREAANAQQPLESGAPSSPAAYQCPGAPPPRLAVGQQGRVTPGLPNRMRSEPSLSAAEVGSIPGEGVFTVVGGPVCADGYTWWQVSYAGTVGWTASGNSAEYWVEPSG